MANSAVQICNIALARIGQKPITSLDDTNNAAILCSIHYDDTRQATLRSVPWRFALEETELAALADAPVRKYARAYQWPSDALYITDTSMDEDGYVWEVQGRKIHTDAPAPIYVTYIKNVTDVALFDALFVDAFAERLAAELVYGITKQAASRSRHLEIYQAKVDEAAAVDGQQGTQMVLEANDLINVRG